MSKRYKILLILLFFGVWFLPAPMKSYAQNRVNKKDAPILDSLDLIRFKEDKWALDSIGCLGYRFDFDYHNHITLYFKLVRKDVLLIFGMPNEISDGGKQFEYWIKAPDYCKRNKSIEELKQLDLSPEESMVIIFDDDFKVSGIFKKTY